MGDHVYEPVTPAANADRITPPAVNPIKDENRHFLRIPLTEELVMADDTGSEPESDQQQRRHGRLIKEEDNDENDEDDDDEEDDDENDDEEDNDNDDDDRNVDKKAVRSNESIYEGENENSSMGDVESSNTRMKVFQQKVKVKADMLRTKLQGVTKRKPKQKIVVDTPNSEKPRRKFGQFATLPKKFTFNAPKVNFSTAFGHFSQRSTDPNESSADETKSGRDETKSGRFSLPRFGLSRTSSESPKPSKSVKIGGSRLSIPGFRPRTWSDASKVSKPDSPKPRIIDFGTYPRIFSKRRKTNAVNKEKTPPPSSDGGEPESNNYKRKDSFHRRFFRSHKESTPAPTEEQTATLAVEEELDEPALQVSKESLAEFGDSDLQEVISLSDDCSRSKDTKSLSEHRSGVIEEIDSDEFFLREKGLSRGDVHISNYLSSEIRDVFRSNRTRSVEGVNDNDNGAITRNNRDSDSGIATPVRPSRTNSLRKPNRHTAVDANTERSYVADRFNTMPKSFGGTRPSKKPEDDMPENIITSQTFEPSQNPVLPSGVPWRTSGRQTTTAATVTHMPPKPPTRQRMSKFSTFDTRSMIDLSRKRSQSQIGFQTSMNFSETVPKAPMRRSRTSLATSDHDISVAVADCGGRPSWTVNGSGAGVPTPPLRRSRMSLTADADIEERSTTAVYAVNGSTPARSADSTPPRPPPPRSTTMTSSTVAGYATVDKSSPSSVSLLLPPQSPMRHRRKKSYDVIKSQEFGAFFTIPRSYSYCDRSAQPFTTTADTCSTAKLPPPSRPARAYNTLGPSRPLRRRLPVREHEYGDVADDGSGRHHHDDENDNDNGGDRNDGTAKAVAALCSGDVIEKMKLRPLPSPPPPPRKSKTADDTDTPEIQRRRNTDSALVPFLDRRETSATSSNDFFADVSRALLASAAKNAVAKCADDVSVAVQTDQSSAADDYASDDHPDDGSCCSAESENRPTKSVAAGSTSRHLAPKTMTAATATTDRTRTRSSSQVTEYVDRPTSGMSVAADDCSCNGYAMVSDAGATAGGVAAVRAQRITVEELQVGRMIVADILGQRMAVDEVSGSSLKIAQFATAAQHPFLQQQQQQLQQGATAAVPEGAVDYPTTHMPQLQHDDTASVQSSRVSSMYPEVDSDEDRASVLAAPTPPRRRSKPPSSPRSPVSADRHHHHDPGKNGRSSGTVGVVDLVTADPSITELSCQLFRLCHSNVCSLFTKVVQQVVPEDTEKRRDLQAALCFLSIILAGLLILGFGNEKTIHHHHWDFQFPPNQ